MAAIPFPLMQGNELASGVRLGGRFLGPKTDTSAIWVGRPPVLASGYAPPTLAIAATPSPAAPAQTVTVAVEGGNAFGGQILRQFSIGGGLSAELRLGNFQHVRARVLGVSDGFAGIPDGMRLYFCWSFDLAGGSDLYSFIDYTTPGTIIALPEGTEEITIRDAGQVTFQVTEFTDTFVRAVAAGETIRALWSGVSLNVATKIICKMRGL